LVITNFQTNSIMRTTCDLYLFTNTIGTCCYPMSYRLFSFFWNHDETTR